MKSKVIVALAAAMITATLTGGLGAASRTSPLIIDHLCTNLGNIPPTWVDEAQAVIKWHYAHTSHGSQLTHGLDTVEAAYPAFDAEIGESFLPTVAGALCVFQGQEDETYIIPEDYWATAEGMDKTRAVLRNNPAINASGFAWCTQLSSATEEYVQAYLDSMTQLETEFPNVTFVYMTGNAQSYGAAENRTLRNRQIRDHCISNNKVLYDFEDLDCWWFNPDTQEWEQGTYTDYWGNVWPVQHPQYDGTEVGHTTWESCLQKGKAVWWMVASLAGWDSSSAGFDSTSSWGEIKSYFE
jgi:hypothetical protein